MRPGKSGANDAMFQYISQQINLLAQECKEIESKLNLSVNSVESFDDIELQVDVIMNQLKHFSSQYKDLSIVEKRELMKLLLDRVVWDGENAHIFIYGSH